MTAPATWQQLLRESLKSTRELEAFLQTTLPQLPQQPLFVPLAMAEKIKRAGKDSPLWRQFIPSSQELEYESGLKDPIGDHTHSQKGQLIHRYQNRALFLPTTRCPIICRYCFRKNELYDTADDIFTPDFQATCDYLKQHPEIEEIIFSGGDPLMLSDQKIWHYARAFSDIGISCLRFHSRFPVIIPQRVDESFIALLKQLSEIFETVSLVIHVNHLDEIDEHFYSVIKELRQLPIYLFSQTVLLNRVNDDSETLISLFQKLGKIGVIPYYLHHPDRVHAAEHFMLPISRGRQIYQKLRAKLPGWSVPQYVLDLPGGHGKVPAYNPESFASKGLFIDQNAVFREYRESQALLRRDSSLSL